MPPAPTWQGMPIEIKEFFVSYLDFKSRLRLRACSKTDMSLVDACPVSLDKLAFCMGSSRRQRENRLEIKEGAKSTEFYRNNIDRFFKILKPRNSFVQNLTLFWDWTTHADENVARNEARKRKLLSKLDTIPKIQARGVYFLADGFSDEEFLRIFQMIDPQELRTLHLFPDLSAELQEKLIATESWKMARTMVFYSRQDIRMDALLHFDLLHYYVHNLSAGDSWKLIDSFRTKKTPMVGYGFRVNTLCQLSEHQIVSAFKIASEKVPNPEASRDPAKHSYLFRTYADGLVLVVRIRRTDHRALEIEAYICTEENAHQEFERFVCQTLLEHFLE